MSKHRTAHNHLDRDIPYWKRAHTDWRFKTAVGVMLVAIAIYVLSDDLSWRPRLQSQAPTSAAGADTK